MTKHTLNPDTLHPSQQYGYSHARISKCRTTIYCAGQVAWDKNFEIVGAGDIRAQTRQALQNVRLLLEAANATVDDIVCLRLYVVDHKPEYLESIGEVMAEFYGDSTPAPNTWIGVQTLALPEFMIEIEATVEIDD